MLPTGGTNSFVDMGGNRGPLSLGNNSIAGQSAA
jgi:hypothetical protein